MHEPKCWERGGGVERVSANENSFYTGAQINFGPSYIFNLWYAADYDGHKVENVVKKCYKGICKRFKLHCWLTPGFYVLISSLMFLIYL
jgi:hypothetical protein